MENPQCFDSPCYKEKISDYSKRGNLYEKEKLTQWTKPIYSMRLTNLLLYSTYRDSSSD